MASLIKLRRDTAANWTSVNPTLAAGEPGLETDTLKVKYGNGTTAWTGLAYAGGTGGSYTLLPASTSQLGGVKVDGSTITINQGVISANQLGGVGGNGTVGAGTAGSLAYYTSSTNVVDDAAGLSWDSVNRVFQVEGTALLQQSTEIINTKTAATGIVTHDFSTGAIWFHSGVAASFTANFTNVPTTNNRASVVTVVILQGSTAYVPNTIQINGAAQQISWLGGTAPTGTANKIDLVSFTLMRVNSTWIATGSLSNYG
jgi:hypothetical protein